MYKWENIEMKMVIRFEKTEAASDLPNDKIIEQFREALLQVSGLLFMDRLSLASSNQKYGCISGIDYMFIDLNEMSLRDKMDLPAALNRILSGKINVSHLVNINDLATPSINKYAYYVSDLSRIQIPSGFTDNLTFIMTRDTNAAGESISVTDSTYRMKGNRPKVILKAYPIIELVPHIHYIPEQKKLYFVADGNTPAFILLTGLLYGKCNYSNELINNIKLFRLDYIDGRQKVRHNTRHYDNVLGECISID
jgi:hypothetical protein